MSMPIMAIVLPNYRVDCRTTTKRRTNSSIQAWLKPGARSARCHTIFWCRARQLGAISIAVLRKQFDKTYVTASFSNQGRAVTMNFILHNSPDGWVIYDVESPHDSLRAFLAQYKN